VRALVLVTTAIDAPGATDADTIAFGLTDGASLPPFAPDLVRELIDSGEARTSYKSLALAHADGRRWLIAGLGDADELDAERLRVVAAAVQARALEIATHALCWVVPHARSDLAGALVEGTILADYRFERFKSGRSAEDGSSPNGPGGDAGHGGDAGQRGAAPKHLERLVVAAPEDAAGEGPASAQELERGVAEAAIVAEAVNAARDLQNRPGNDLTPMALGEYARELAQELDSVSVEVEGREGIAARSMGAFAAVAQGSEQEPALITLRYRPPADARGGAPATGARASADGADAGAADGGAAPPVLGLVGKAVTFDSGGISLKPGAKMSEMKFDMSGGAAVIGAIAAIARLRLPVPVLGVVGATENLPSGRAVKPGDIVTASNGVTIEVNNTDAEGRLVLADCLHHAVTLGAERIVDLATLTGAVIVALGSTYAGLMSNDDEFAQRVAEAGERTGEIVWRLPLHEEYDEHIKGRYADLDNAPEERKAGPIVGGAFLSNFVEDVPWVHLDIAGSAWDLGRPYAPKGAAGYGVRLLVELARSYCG
jgi:leucyl aminopeptidase